MDLFRRNSGGLAPFFSRLKNVPSRWIPTISDPASLFWVSIAFLISLMDKIISSLPTVFVVAKKKVVPFSAKNYDITYTSFGPVMPSDSMYMKIHKPKNYQLSAKPIVSPLTSSLERFEGYFINPFSFNDQIAGNSIFWSYFFITL
jgi:hypothetical protein